MQCVLELPPPFSSALACPALLFLTCVLVVCAVVSPARTPLLNLLTVHSELPEGWEILPNEADGRPYYVNQSTGASQWEQPTA